MTRYFPTKLYSIGGIVIIILSVTNFMISYEAKMWVLTSVLFVIGIFMNLFSFGKIQWIDIGEDYFVFKNMNKTTKILWSEIHSVYADNLLFLKVIHIFHNNGKLQLVGYHDKEMVKKIVGYVSSSKIDPRLYQRIKN